MRYYLCLLLIAVCEAGILTKSLDLYPSKSHSVDNEIYHGHGAISYQKTQVHNHHSIPVIADADSDLEHHAQAIIPIVESHSDVDHIDISDSAPFEELTDAGFGINSDAFDHSLDHYDVGHDYDFH